MLLSTFFATEVLGRHFTACYALTRRVATSSVVDVFLSRKTTRIFFDLKRVLCWN